MSYATDTTVRTAIADGDQILLWFEDDVSYLITVKAGATQGVHKGAPLAHDALIGKQYGEWIACAHGRCLLLRPTLEEMLLKTRRESGIIYPKDAALLMMKTGIRPGCTVLEVGTGSGALLQALAAIVAPTGHVDSYDVREDFLALAAQNLNRARLTDYVTLTHRLPRTPFPRGDYDIAVLDIPTPWEEVETVRQALTPGGRLASLNPTFNQIEQMAEALKRAGFVKIESGEVLYRPILARAGKTRPQERMVSHTEFLLFAVKG